MEFNKEMKDELVKAFNESLEGKLETVVGKEVARQTRSMVETLQASRRSFSRDITGLNEKQKKDFVNVARAAANINGVDLKANEALIEEQDNRGGFLVSKEVADAILRIAASVGTIMSQAQKWPMTTDELAIPNYTGAFLTGAYLGVDVAGNVTGLVFGQALLIAKKWQLAFVVGNDLLADATVELADWLLVLAGEALANVVDQQGFVGSTSVSSNGVTVGGPFVGIMGNTQTTSYVLGTGKTGFSNNTTVLTASNGFDVLVDSSNMIGNLEESILDDAAFYVHRSVWAAWRVQKDSNGNFILPFAGLASPAALTMDHLGGPIKPAGSILGFPVYTNRWLPTLATSASNTAFAIFGNMRAMAWGDRGELRIAQFESGAFGGKEVALSDQKGIVYKHRHALVIALPAAFVVAKTAVS